MEQLPEILLWLFIMNLGIAFGAGLYETKIILPQWFNKSEDGVYSVNLKAMNETDTGRKFWGFVTTMPLTLLTIANLIVALRSGEPRHDWWLASSLIVLVERMATFCFFIPVAIQLMKADTLKPEAISSKVNLWIRLNYFRNLLTVLGWIAALKTLSIIAS